MMRSEFIERTGYNPSSEEYEIIEEAYYNFPGDKNEFCKWWLGARECGFWDREMALRAELKAVKKDREDWERRANAWQRDARSNWERAIAAEGKLAAAREALR